MSESNATGLVLDLTKNTDSEKSSEKAQTHTTKKVRKQAGTTLKNTRCFPLDLIDRVLDRTVHVAQLVHVRVHDTVVYILNDNCDHTW